VLLRLLYFLSHSTFFKGKENRGIFGGFYVFFKWAFLKKTGVFVVESNYIKPKDHYGYLIDFLSQISKLFYI